MGWGQHGGVSISMFTLDYRNLPRVVGLAAPELEPAVVGFELDEQILLLRLPRGIGGVALVVPVLEALHLDLVLRDTAVGIRIREDRHHGLVWLAQTVQARELCLNLTIVFDLEYARRVAEQV